MTKLGPPFKKEEDKKVARLFTFDRSTSKKLDEMVPAKKRSPFVNKTVKEKLKRMTKGPDIGVEGLL